MPRDGKWVWIPVSTMGVSHLFYAIMNQVRATEEIEGRLQHLLSLDSFDPKIDRQIDHQIRLLGMRHRRFELLRAEYIKRGVGPSFVKALEAWSSGSAFIDAKGALSPR